MNIQKWEYKYISIYNEKEWNKLGNEGWELVAVASHDNSKDSFIFKRPLTEKINQSLQINNQYSDNNLLKEMMMGDIDEIPEDFDPFAPIN